MGYRIFQHSSSFFMSAENQAKAQEAVAQFAKQCECYEARELKDPNVVSLLKAYNYFPKLDDNRNIVSIHFQGGKLLDDHYMFDVLAPFVPQGSFVAMSAYPDEPPAFSWLFDGKQCLEQGRGIVR
jgi:hypothetical protein